jgi:hypothetical protein
MATQIAKHIFGAQALCRIYDPIREEIYRGMDGDHQSHGSRRATVEDTLERKQARAPAIRCTRSVGGGKLVTTCEGAAGRQPRGVGHRKRRR